jgi:hypothetical protein
MKHLAWTFRMASPWFSTQLTASPKAVFQRPPEILRPCFKFASRNVHAGSKGMTPCLVNSKAQDECIFGPLQITTINAVREFCVNQSCTVVHSTANGASDAPVTH